MQQSNYHSHCTFCDGRSHPEDFVRFALSHGFRAYGFSSHSPLPFETNWNMSKDEMPAYLAEIQRLKEKYDGDERVRTLIDTARALEGMPRNTSTHAAGVVITRRPVYDYVPLSRNDDTIVTQFTMTTI